MEELFSKLALHTVSVVGKAAFGMAANKVVRTLSAYAKQNIASNQKQPMDRSKIESLRIKLENKIGILTPSIDMIQLACAKSNNVGLSAVLTMAQDLKMDVDQLSNDMEQCQEEDQVIVRLQSVLYKIKEVVPYINLALSVSGVKLGANLTQSLSPSVLLNASALVQHAHTQQSETLVKLDISFACRFYKLFEGSVRKDGMSWTWKEEYHLCTVTVEQSQVPSDNYCSTLVITEDLEDGRVHDNTVPYVSTIQTASIRRMFFTVAGKLLNIEDAVNAVIVIKTVHEPQKGKTDRTSQNESIERTKLPVDLNEAWYALEIVAAESDWKDNGTEDEGEYDDENESISSDIAGDDSSGIQETQAVVTSSSNTELNKTQTILRLPFRSTQLILLDVLIRLLCLESAYQASHLRIPDDVLSVYLCNDGEEVADISSKGGTNNYNSPQRSSFDSTYRHTPLHHAAVRLDNSPLASPSNKGRRSTPKRDEQVFDGDTGSTSTFVARLKK